MLLSMLKKIKGFEITLSNVTLTLVDMSIKYPYDVVEDVLVKVETFIFLVAFIILDIEKEYDYSILLG